jgi:hypothetical protein
MWSHLSISDSHFTSNVIRAFSSFVCSVTLPNPASDGVESSKYQSALISMFPLYHTLPRWYVHMAIWNFYTSEYITNFYVFWKQNLVDTVVLASEVCKSSLCNKWAMPLSYTECQRKYRDANRAFFFAFLPLHLYVSKLVHECRHIYICVTLRNKKLFSSCLLYQTNLRLQGISAVRPSHRRAT